jgi:hypothetical protein
MIPKSGHRFSDKIMRKRKERFPARMGALPPRSVCSPPPCGEGLGVGVKCAAVRRETNATT